MSTLAIIEAVIGQTKDEAEKIITRAGYTFRHRERGDRVSLGFVKTRINLWFEHGKVTKATFG